MCDGADGAETVRFGRDQGLARPIGTTQLTKEEIMSGGRAARRLGTVAIAGAALQLVYGVLAVVWPYPLIIAPAPELVWGVVNIGMLAGIAAWLAIDVAQPRWLALIGGGVAILGHLMRVAVSIWTSIQPGANPDSVTATILASIALMFAGMALLAIGTVVGRRLSGLGRWAPGLVLATGLVTAAFYSIERMVHFVLLGLLWGAAWLLLAYVAHREATKPIISAIQLAPPPSPSMTTMRPLTSNTSRAR
jgi:hypothetical protein